MYSCFARVLFLYIIYTVWSATFTWAIIIKIYRVQKINFKINGNQDSKFQPALIFQLQLILCCFYRFRHNNLIDKRNMCVCDMLLLQILAAATDRKKEKGIVMDCPKHLQTFLPCFTFLFPLFLNMNFLSHFCYICMTIYIKWRTDIIFQQIILQSPPERLYQMII